MVMTPEQQQFLEQCKKEGFEVYQLNQIGWGFESDIYTKDKLTIEQIKIFAKKEFDWKQMEEIRLGFYDGLTIEQISLYARPELIWGQMKEIRRMFYNKLTFEEVREKVTLMLLES